MAEQAKGQSLKEVVRRVRDFDGLQGAFGFDEFGDVRRPHVSISRVRDGQFVVLE